MEPNEYMFFAFLRTVFGEHHDKINPSMTTHICVQIT